MALPKDSSRQGFTLIVIGILLLAFGMFAMSMLTPTVEIDKDRERVTDKRLDKIRVALYTYYKTNSNKYPCPARLNIALDTSAFGASVNACDAATNCSTAGGGIFCPASTTKTWIGGVPVKTLGLSDDYAFDEWGNRFTYAVNNNNTFAIKNLSNSTIANTKIFAVSHGKNGKGSYNRGGSNAVPCTATGGQTITNSELGNCNFSTDDIFIYSQWSTATDTYYDDVTFYFSAEN